MSIKPTYLGALSTKIQTFCPVSWGTPGGICCHFILISFLPSNKRPSAHYRLSPHPTHYHPPRKKKNQTKKESLEAAFLPCSADTQHRGVG